MKCKVQFITLIRKKCNISRKNESTEWLYLDLIFQEFASWSELFWGLKCKCSVTTSPKNILKTFLGPPRSLESLVIKQFVQLVNSLIGLFSTFWPTVPYYTLPFIRSALQGPNRPLLKAVSFDWAVVFYVHALSQCTSIAMFWGIYEFLHWQSRVC